jgi:hypothetical protein
VAVDDGTWIGFRRSTPLLLGVTGAYAALAAMTKPNTAPALVAVAVPAVVVARMAMDRPTATSDEPPRLRRAALWWGAIVTIALLWEAAAYLGEHTVGQYQYPTLSVLAEPALQNPVVRFGAWLLWLWAGWRLVRR